MTKSNSKRIIRILLAVFTITSLFFVPWTILFAWLKPLSDNAEEEVQNALNHGFEGIIVYVDQAGKKPEFFTAGWHDRDKKIPARSDALFKIASISKLYNAVAIAKLVHSQKLSLDKTLADYFPELRGRIEYADKISLEMLVKHRSGIPNFTDSPGFWVHPPKSSEEALNLILDQPALYEPDTKYSYCNTNYLLISMLIEKTLGYDVFQYIQEEILNPLQLKHTYKSIYDINMDDLMSGYYVGVEQDIKTTDYGSMIASAEDVGKFIRALNDGSVFKEGEQEIYSSIYVYEHTGLIAGYQSIAKYHKDIDTVVIQFTNTTDFDGYQWNLSEIVYNRIIKILRKKKNS